jgi:hypothetical protein
MVKSGATTNHGPYFIIKNYCLTAGVFNFYLRCESSGADEEKNGNSVQGCAQTKGRLWKLGLFI